MSAPLLEVDDLSLAIPTDEGLASILDHVSLTIPTGRIVGVVGESGCGKSTLVKAILGLVPKRARIGSGAIRFNGRTLLDGAGPAPDMGDVRGRDIGFVPQDPFLSLNPVFKVGTQLMEILSAHGLPDERGEAPVSAKARRERHRAHIVGLLKRVQMPDPEQALERYPHEFSGGQRQRILIAGALACRPPLILADEPTTALDVTTQLQILRLIRDLAEEFGVAVALVTHDFGVVAQTCDEVAVLYAGQTVESGSTRALVDAPRHPYAQALIGCHPDRSGDFIGIPGLVPSALRPPPGCRFHPRCVHAVEACRAARPPLVRGAQGAVACVLHPGGA